MQPAMPRFLNVQTKHVSRNGTETSVDLKGYEYPGGECACELRASVECLEKVLEKDHT